MLEAYNWLVFLYVQWEVGKMVEPAHNSNQPNSTPPDSSPVLEYGREPSRWRRDLPEEEQRRLAAWCIAIALSATLAWCFVMFLARRPALDYFCIFGFTPIILAMFWLSLSWQLVLFLKRFPKTRKVRWIVVIIFSFLLAPYCFLRAGSDMFTLSLRYHLARAGGAEKVRNAFNQWILSRPVFDASADRKLLFAQGTPGGTIVRLSPGQLPPEVRYINERFPSRFGFSERNVAVIDNVSVLTTTDIMIGPSGWEPEGDIPFWGRIVGSRRKLADGIWVQFGTYDK